MDAVEWKYAVHKGMPADGEAGYFLGYDDDLQPYIMKWKDDEHPCWLAVSLDDRPLAHNGAGPVAHALVDNNLGKITSYAVLPLRWSVLGVPSPDKEGEQQ